MHLNRRQKMLINNLLIKKDFWHFGVGKKRRTFYSIKLTKIYLTQKSEFNLVVVISAQQKTSNHNQIKILNKKDHSGKNDYIERSVNIFCKKMW